jgi:hypothetical protein
VFLYLRGCMNGWVWKYSIVVLAFIGYVIQQRVSELDKMLRGSNSGIETSVVILHCPRFDPKDASSVLVDLSCAKAIVMPGVHTHTFSKRQERRARSSACISDRSFSWSGFESCILILDSLDTSKPSITIAPLHIKKLPGFELLPAWIVTASA